jgi:predicted metal-dependent hydrolase
VRPSPLVRDLQPSLPFETHQEPILTRNPRARRYILRVAGDGTVCVTMPRWGSRREALEFAASQHPWVEQQRTRIARERATEPPPLSREHQRRLITRARAELPRRLHELAVQFDLRVTRVSIRNQRWRWGSCSPRGHICLNWRLVAMPDWVRDYVLIHELMHLKRMDHSRGFWKLVAAACPRYQEARSWLRGRRAEVTGLSEDD